MSKLYASITSDARHIESHTRGWDLGVRVVASHDQIRRDEDVFEVYVTAGSNGGPADVLVGRVAFHDGERYFYPVDESIYRGNGSGRTDRCACGQALDANGEHDGGYGSSCG